MEERTNSTSQESPTGAAPENLNMDPSMHELAGVYQETGVVGAPGVRIILAVMFTVLLTVPTTLIFVKHQYLLSTCCVQVQFEHLLCIGTV